MGKESTSLTPTLIDFIEKQHIFFVATAPRADTGRINLSPKGLDSFRVLGPTTVAYLDLTGSGNETASHVEENGRITFLFCSFDREPLILRLYGHARVVLPGTPECDDLETVFDSLPGLRQYIVAEIATVKESCGFGIPLMDIVAERDTLTRWALSKGEDGLAEYRREKNSVSMDGIPAPSLDRE